MLSIGIFTKDNLTAVAGSVEQLNGEIEKEVIVLVAGDVFQATALALMDATMIRAKPLRIYTNDAQLLEFLSTPICVKPTEFVRVKGWRKKVGIGGNPDQWTILYRLFACGSWKIRQVAKLPGTEAIYDEYHKSTTGRSISGCCRRLYEGVWASA